MANFSRDDHMRGHWLPKDPAILKRWIQRKVAQVEAQYGADSFRGYDHPVLQEFQDLIEKNADIYMGFTEMFNGVPGGGPIDNYKKMLAVFDIILSEAPEFIESTCIAFPITTIVVGPMATPAGFNMFSNDRVNAVIKKVLDAWYEYLCSPESRYVLNDGPTGWFGPVAKKAIPNFAETYECDPSAPYWGFSSWHDFFTRSFRPGIRPVQFGQDPSIVNSACESEVYRIEYDIRERDRFWVKGHPYSVAHMLNCDELANNFVGGTVYQAYLSALDYHRWHSPVDGTVVKTVVVPGTYYLQSPDTIQQWGGQNGVRSQTSSSWWPFGSDATTKQVPGPDVGRIHYSQEFMTQVAARCLIFIESDNPVIGLMCFVGVGMEEASTCLPTVLAGQKVKKGDDIGTFRFGGSTYCLVFAKGARIRFGRQGREWGAEVGKKVLLNEAIGSVEV